MRNLSVSDHIHPTLLSRLGFFLALCISVSLLMTACPDPEGQYNTFIDRQDETIAANSVSNAGEEAGVTAGEEAGMTAGDEAGTTAGDDMPDLVPRIVSGTYLFGLAPNLNVDLPMTFVAEVEITINEDGSGGQVASIRLDPRMCDDLNSSAGDLVEFNPDMPAEIGADSYFSANFGRVTVAGDANCISGSPIEAEIQLDGRVSSAETLCGEMNGMLYRPYPADLGYSEITMERSTFGAMKINGDENINELSIPKNCTDVNALISESSEMNSMEDAE